MPDDPAPLKTDPKYGHYPWWPEDGDSWVHPEDVATARSMIPSPRVWRRDGREGDFVVMRYGATSIRVRRTLWVETPHEGLEIGDLVEVIPEGIHSHAETGRVRDVHWDAHAGGLRYLLQHADGAPIDHAFGAQELKHVERPQPREEARIEPSDDVGEIPTVE